MVTARLLVIVGAKPVFFDTHVWEPILRSGADIIYVGGKEADYCRLEAAFGSRLEFVCEEFVKGLPRISERLEAFAKS